MAERTCSVKNCGKPVRSKGLCHNHYEQERYHSARSAKFQSRITVKECAWEDCTALFVICAAKGNSRQKYCEDHQFDAITAVKRRAHTTETARRAKRRERLKRFNLTIEDYDRLLEQQDGRCAVCGTADPSTPRFKNFSVDHDHACCPGDGSCGKCIRGLLCLTCNRVLGMVNDDRARLRAMVAYLDKFV